MKTFEVDVNINGTITFEVKAKNKEQAQEKVNELLENSALREALGKYRSNLSIYSSAREKKVMER